MNPQLSLVYAKARHQELLERSARRGRFAGGRGRHRETATPVLWEGLTLRLATSADRPAVARLAELDQASRPAEPVLLGVVMQRPLLFAGTVAENIALGQPGASAAAIRQAARLAGAEDFIAALAHGFDTRLGERALALSAGQRQRIALARAFLRDAPLVLLDEPTAHLDPATAREIMETIGLLTASRTVVLVTHQAYRPGQDVLGLDHGRLVPAANESAAAESAAAVLR